MVTPIQNFMVETGYIESYKIACALREDSDQPVCPYRLSRHFAGRVKVFWIFN